MYSEILGDRFMAWYVWHACTCACPCVDCYVVLFLSSLYTLSVIQSSSIVDAILDVMLPFEAVLPILTLLHPHGKKRIIGVFATK